MSGRREASGGAAGAVMRRVRALEGPTVWLQLSFSSQSLCDDQVSRDREALEAQLALERAERAQEAAAAAAAERAARAELEGALRAAAQRTAALDAEVRAR